MLKRLLFPLTLLLCLAVATTSCRDDDDGLIDLPEELVSGPIRISVPENPWRIKSAADYYAFYVECQGSGWIATCESEWLTLTPTEGSESQYIRFDVEENTEPFARVAVITIADAKEPDTYRVQVRIRQSGYNDEDNATLTGDMQKKHRMGYGYDIMKEYASDGSYSDNPVLDYDKVVEAEEAKGITIISEDRRHYQDLEIFSGTTITELAGKLTRNMDSKATFLGCGKISDTKTDIYRTKTIEEVCGLVRLKQIISSRTIDIGMLRSQATSDDSPLYSKEFRKALKELNENNAYAFLNKFRTHLVVSADLGGSLELHTTITRETSIETQHSVTTVTKKVFGKNKGQSSQSYDTYQGDIGIDYKADLTCVGGDSKTHGVMQAAVNAKRQITPDEIKKWQASFNIAPADTGKEYNVGMVGCRLIPIYEIINDPDKRRLVQIAFSKYTKSPEMAPKPEDTPARIEIDIVRKEWLQRQSSCALKADTRNKNRYFIFVKEYVPAIRRDDAVIIAYPFIEEKPYFYCGVFIGDADNHPGAVRWLGNNCLYEPNDSVRYDNAQFAHLFDANSKSLKQLYFYNAAVQIMPPKQNNKYIVEDSIHSITSVHPLRTSSEKIIYSAGDDENDKLYLIKVGPLMWFEASYSLQKRDIIDSTDYAPFNKSEGVNKFHMCKPTNDLYQAFYWSDINHYLPTDNQINSLMKVCNGNEKVLFELNPGNLSNLLGLKWGKGAFRHLSGSSYDKFDTEAIVFPIRDMTSKQDSLLDIARITKSGRASRISMKDYQLATIGSTDCATLLLPIYMVAETFD